MAQAFKTFLTEHYVNAFKADEKKKYAQEVWDILQASYAYIGGIKGDEFKTPETMLSVPFWKIVVRDKKVVAVSMFKDLNGRKSIAAGTDGSAIGKTELAKMYKEGFERSYSEISGAAEKFVVKNFPDLYKKYRVPVDEVEKIINKKITPSDDGYHYTREIAGTTCTKVLVGTPGKKFY